MPFPALVGEAVIVAGISIKMNVEPVLVFRIPTLFTHILKGKKASSHMVKDTIQNNADPIFLENLTNFGKICIASQTTVYLSIISRIIAMPVRLKDRRKINGIHMETLKMGNPLYNFSDSRNKYPVIFLWSAAKSQRVDLIKNAVIEPHNTYL